MTMRILKICETRDEFIDFISNYEGELHVNGSRAWDGDVLVAYIAKIIIK